MECVEYRAFRAKWQSVVTFTTNQPFHSIRGE
jgi:hypothetical protein